MQDHEPATHLLANAISHHQAGQFAEAERLYRVLLQKDPAHPDANHNLGILAGQVGHAEGGLPFLRNAVTTSPDREHYALSYSNALLTLGKAEDARHFLESAIDRGLNTAALRCNLGNAARALGQFDHAKENFQAALALDPGHALAHYNLATLLQDTSDIEGAVAGFRHALMQNPAFVEAHNNLGICLQALQRPDEAIASFRDALKANDNHADAHFNLGNALEQAGQSESALASFRKAFALDPTHAEALNKIGLIALKLGRLDESERSLRQVLALKPQFADAHNNLGNTLHALQRREDAIACYHGAIALRPDYPEALSNLANVYFEQGDFHAAEQSCRQALAINPDLHEAHLNLANALQALGAWDVAVAHYRAVLQQHPDFADAHYNLGNVLQKLERHDEAEASYRQALQFKPQFAYAHNNLGNVLRQLGRLNEAAQSYHHAIQLQPDYAEAHNNLGIALQSFNLIEAEAHCRRALELNPRLTEAMVFLADILSNRGEFVDAEAWLHRAIQINPAMSDAWAGIPTLRKMTEADDRWIARAQELVTLPLPARSMAYLRHAMGKYHDDIKQYELAFINHQTANDLSKQYAPRYDRRQAEQFADLVIAGFSKEFFDGPHSGANASTRPVFVVGMPRSGTSLAEQIIAAHPAAFGAGELFFWEPALHGFDLHGAHVESQLAALAGNFLALLDKCSPEAQRVVDKMPTNFRCLGLIRAAFPHAKIIHMERNPVDTCLSIYFQHFDAAHPYANDLDNLAHQFRQYRRIMEHWQDVLPAQSLLHVPYEGLVENQEHWTRIMLEFVDLPWDARCLDFHLKERTVGTASKWQVRQKMNRTSVERWRNYQQFVGPLLGLLD